MCENVFTLTISSFKDTHSHKTLTHSHARARARTRMSRIPWAPVIGMKRSGLCSPHPTLKSQDTPTPSLTVTCFSQVSN